MTRQVRVSRAQLRTFEAMPEWESFRDPATGEWYDEDGFNVPDPTNPSEKWRTPPLEEWPEPDEDQIRWSFGGTWPRIPDEEWTGPGFAVPLPDLDGYMVTRNGYISIQTHGQIFEEGANLLIGLQKFLTDMWNIDADPKATWFAVVGLAGSVHIPVADVAPYKDLRVSEPRPEIDRMPGTGE